MKQIKKFGVVQTAKVVALLYLIGSAIFAIPVGLVGLVVGRSRGLLGILFLFTPLLYCAFGFIFVAIGCLLYNFVARKIGGIEVELDAE